MNRESHAHQCSIDSFVAQNCRLASIWREYQFIKEINDHNQLPTVPGQCGGKRSSNWSDLLLIKVTQSDLLLINIPNTL